MENRTVFPAHWDEKQIICSLYYWIADSDFKIHTDELNVIHKKLDQLFFRTFYLSVEEKENIVAEVEHYIAGASDQQKMEWIRLFSKQVVLTTDLYREMIQAMEAIALADDFISIEEHSLMYYIRLKFKKNSSPVVYSLEAE
jgi:hypothetical protein